MKIETRLYLGTACAFVGLCVCAGIALTSRSVEAPPAARSLDVIARAQENLDAMLGPKSCAEPSGCIGFYYEGGTPALCMLIAPRTNAMLLTWPPADGVLASAGNTAVCGSRL